MHSNMLFSTVIRIKTLQDKFNKMEFSKKINVKLFNRTTVKYKAIVYCSYYPV